MNLNALLKFQTGVWKAEAVCLTSENQILIVDGRNIPKFLECM